MKEEILEIVDRDGNVIGKAPRSEIHGNPSLIHKVVHVLVFNPDGGLLLQKRSLSKDVAPGRWDTSVGGHMEPGETLEAAAMREMAEELGIAPGIELLYDYMHSNDYETEMVFTFRAVHGGQVRFDPEEIDAVRAWYMSEIRSALGTGALSDNFEHEFRTYLEHTRL